MLKRDALLKFVFDAVEKGYTGTKPLSAGELAAFQKELAAALKPLPQGARFTFADRTFPGDEIEVLNDLTASLEQAHVNIQPLLGGGDKPRKAAKAKLEEAAAGAMQKLAEHKPPETRATSAKQPSLPMRGDPPDLSTPMQSPPHTSLQGKQHIHILTEKLQEG